MKKITLSFLTILTLISYSYGQKMRGWHLGGSAMLQVPIIFNQNTYGDPEYEYAADLHSAWGISAAYNFKRSFGFQTGIYYSFIGQTYEDIDYLNRDIYREVDLDYIQIPVLAKYNTKLTDVRFYSVLGPQFGLLTKADIRYTIDGVDKGTPDAKERFSNFDMGIVLGTGMQYDISENLYISAGLRFYVGLMDINAKEWRTPNLDNVYDPSLNGYGGVRVALYYYWPEGVGSKNKKKKEKEKKEQNN